MVTINIIARRLADGLGPLEIVTYCDQANEGARYETAPCANTILGEQAAIQAHIAVRKAAGADYAGQPAPAPDTVMV